MTNEQIQALKALYANVEMQAHALRGNSREYSVITGLCPVNVIEMQAQKIQALLVESEADKALIAKLQTANAAQDCHINQQADRIDSLERTNHGLGKRLCSVESLTLTVKLPDEYYNADGSRNMDMIGTCAVVGSFRVACAAMLQGRDEPITTDCTLPADVRGAINRLLDSDGSRGTFSAVWSCDAREESMRLLAIVPQHEM
ncbi:hypothetical protein KXR87_08350 [Yokenella regensburgei]|uniref:hypothetical protein n=1 Tax=Yokenella regensburgei TaxID=158877 RepID=UPI003F1669C3